MSQNSTIEWTEATWNPVRGCVKVSPGCANCYAETFAERWRGVEGHAYEQGFDLRLVPDKLDEPLRRKKPTTYFVNSMSDLFQEGVPDEFIDQVFAVMALCPQHTFQILTKRPDRMRAYVTPHPPLGIYGAYDRLSQSLSERRDDWKTDRPILWPLPNAWLGVSVENQRFADERIPLLLQTPAAVRFLSVEPMLQAIDLRLGASEGEPTDAEPLRERNWLLHWVIVGGESGHGARPFHIGWASSIVDQCRDGGVPVFVKQLGAVPLCDGGDLSAFPSTVRFVEDDGEGAQWFVKLRDRKGGDMNEWPEDLRVREMPPR